MKKLFKILLITMLLVASVAAFSACNAVDSLVGTTVPDGVNLKATVSNPGSGSNSGNLPVSVTIENTTGSDFVFKRGAVQVSAPGAGGQGSASFSVQNTGDVTVGAGKTETVSITVKYNSTIGGDITVKYGTKTIPQA